MEIAQAALPGTTAPLLVSPQLRVFFSEHRAELLFGESEVLVAAKHIVDGHALCIAPRIEISYIHLMRDSHEIRTANGAETERFFAEDRGLSALGPAARHELFALFPALRSPPPGPDSSARTQGL